jgi:hypothetical protein
LRKDLQRRGEAPGLLFGYVEHQLPLKAPGAIAEVLVGPLAPKEAEDMVRDLLTANGYPAGIPVLRSTSSI